LFHLKKLLPLERKGTVHFWQAGERIQAMEHKQFIYSFTEGSGGTDELNAQLVQRRQAIQLFLSNPQAAIDLYPHLEEELVTFFSQSSNPHMDDTTGEPIAGREEEFNKWDAVRHWARTR
jgi:hypothetical protein